MEALDAALRGQDVDAAVSAFNELSETQAPIDPRLLAALANLCARNRKNADAWRAYEAGCAAAKGVKALCTWGLDMNALLYAMCRESTLHSHAETVWLKMRALKLSPDKPPLQKFIHALISLRKFELAFEVFLCAIDAQLTKAAGRLI